MDDAQLLKAYAEEKSEAAFAELVRRHVDLVYSAALRQVGGDPHRAQEAAQGVFLDLARKARALAGHPALAGWLYTSTFYAAAKLMRAERRRTLRERQAAATAAACDTPAADWQRVQPVLDAAMHALGGPERNAIVLRFFEQRPMTEVGRLLGLSESGARKNVERGLDRLRVELGRRGIASAPAALSLALASHAVGAAPAGLAATISQGACAGAAGGGVLAFIFMSTIKMQVGVAAAVLAAGGWWLTLHRETGRLRAENAGIQARLAQLTTETQTAVARTAALRAEIDAGAGTDAASPGLPEPQPGASVTLARARSQLDQTYAGLFRQLKLDPETLADLRERLAERRVRAWQVWSYAARATGRSMDEWANKTDELDYIATGTRDIDERIRALLGPDRYTLYANYERTLPWRGPFEELATMLAPIEPLTEEQIDQLATWAADESPNLFTDPTKGDSGIPPGVLRRAKTLLTSRQWEKLAQAEASASAYRQMQAIAIAENAANAGATGRVSPPP